MGEEETVDLVDKCGIAMFLTPVRATTVGECTVQKAL